MSASLEFAAMDPLMFQACLLCGERFEAEGYSKRFKPELLPSFALPVDGFAPAILLEDKPAGFVCPECFGDGKGELARSMERGARRLRELAAVLEKGET